MDDSSYSDDDVYEDSRSTGSGGQFEENSRRQSGRGEEGITRTTSTGGGRGQASIADKDGSTTASQTPRAVQQYCTCQRVYLEAQNSKKTLFLLAIGLMDDDGHDVFSFDNEPWSRLPKASMKPQNGEFLREINRRATLYNIQPRPHPMNWKRPRIVQWLHENPVRESDCKSFLFAEVEKLRNILLRLQVQATESAPTGTSKWRSKAWPCKEYLDTHYRQTNIDPEQANHLPICHTMTFLQMQECLTWNLGIEWPYQESDHEHRTQLGN